MILALSVGAAYVAFQVTNKEKKEEVKVVVEPRIVKEEVPTELVLVARSPIPVGTPLKPEMLDRQPWPKHLIVGDFIISDGQDSDVSGMVTRAPFQANEPIIRTKLANPSDPSFLAAWVRDGMRAVTVSVDGISGVAGFIYPGDHVDVILTHNVPVNKDPASADSSTKDKTMPLSEVMIQDVKVLAVDQKYSTEPGQLPTAPNSVTIEVSPVDAQKIRLAENNKGSISLALRGIKKDENAESAFLPRPVGVADLSRTLPPTYYPILFEADNNFRAKVINPYKGETANQEGSDENMENLADLKSLSSQAMEKLSGETSITIFRGTQKETVGVANQ